MTPHDACLRALTDQTTDLLKDLLGREGEGFQKLLKEEYLGFEDPQLHPDSHEASEAVEVDSRRISAAVWKWRKLTPTERGTALEVVRRLGGEPEEVKHEIRTELPIDADEPPVRAPACKRSLLDNLPPDKRARAEELERLLRAKLYGTDKSGGQAP